MLRHLGNLSRHCKWRVRILSDREYIKPDTQKSQRIVDSEIPHKTCTFILSQNKG